METPYFDELQKLVAKYGIEIRKGPKDTVIVVFNELPDGRGASVGSLFEHLATEIYKKYFPGTPIFSIVWILHHHPEETDIEMAGETYEQVILQWDGHHFRSMRKIPLPEDSWEMYGLKDG